MTVPGSAAREWSDVGARRGRFATVVAALALEALALAACRHAPGHAPNGAPAPDGHAERVGDTLALPTRIVRVRPGDARATIELDRPAYVVLLSVDPGRSIEIISVAPQRRLAGSHTVSVEIPNGALTLGRSLSGVAQRIPDAARPAFESCVQRTTKPPSSRRVARQVPRDSTGRPIDGGPAYESVDVPGVSMEQAERICADRIETHAHARPPGYLLVLASTVPLTWPEVDARLRGFTARTADARGTMEAVAEGLYVNRGAVWSGAFVHW